MWVTQNIAAAGKKPMNILMSQELLKNCLHILNNSVELEHEALQLLDIIVDSKWKELELDDKQEVQQSVAMVLKKDFGDPLVHISLKVLSLTFKHDRENVPVAVEFLLNLNSDFPAFINASASNPKLYSLLPDLLHFAAFLSTDQHPAVAQHFPDIATHLKIPKIFEF